MEEEDTDVISSGFEVWFEELGAEALSAGKSAFFFFFLMEEINQDLYLII